MIPFPKMHIAESVLNRIQNALEDTGPLSLTVMEPPIVPDPLANGLRIEEEAIKTPVEAGPPPGLEQQTEDGLVAESVQGGSPFDGALIGALGG